MKHLSTVQNILFILFWLFLIIGLLFQLKEERKRVIICLALSSICLFSFSTFLDPFLNLWDERYHALVAKNMINHFWKPTLYENPILPGSYDGWGSAHIWLHKQPLFLWQMALSMAVFGENEFALRLPDVVLCTAVVLVLYRIGILLANSYVGFISACLFLCSVYIIELVSGRKELEHNDISFLAYVTFSIWAFIEYQISKKNKWIYMIGLFSGMAILCKWLVGLMVYAVWFIYKIYIKNFHISSQKDILIALSITIVVFMPWQIFSFWAYPTEAAKEMSYNSVHFFKVVEGHGGDFYYHFERMKEMNGNMILLIFPISMILFFMNSKDQALSLSIISVVIITYTFFTIAATKMPSFTLISFPWISFMLAFCIDYVMNLAKNKYPKFSFHFTFPLIIISIFLIRFDFAKILENHTHSKPNYYSGSMQYNKMILKELDLQENEVLFNVGGGHFVEAMFYTNRIVYPFIPNQNQVDILAKKGYKAVILIENEIPSALVNAKNLRIIKKEIKVIDI